MRYLLHYSDSFGLLKTCLLAFSNNIQAFLFLEKMREIQVFVTARKARVRYFSKEQSVSWLFRTK